MRCKCTKKVVQQAIELKASGLSNIDICNALGMSESAFYRWLQIGSDTSGAFDGDKNIRLKRALVEGLKKAEAEYKQYLLDTVKAAAEKPSNWTAAAWLLERQYPNEFGKSERRFDEGKTTAPTIVLGVPVAVIQNDAPVEVEAVIEPNLQNDGRSGGIAPEIEAREVESLPGAKQEEVQ